LRGTDDVRDLAPLAHQYRKAAYVLAGALLSLAAQAQWSGSVSVDSDYRYRGVTLSGSKPSVRVSANYDSAAGWYAGASVAQAQVTADRYAQLLGYAGYVLAAGAGRSLDLGATAYAFVGNHQYDFAEVYAGLVSERWSLRANYSPDYFGRHVQTVYLDASGHLQLSDAVRLFAHAGAITPVHGESSPFPGVSKARFDMRTGLGWALPDVDLTAAWSTASSGGPFPAGRGRRRSGWQFSASYFF